MLFWISIFEPDLVLIVAAQDLDEAHMIACKRLGVFQRRVMGFQIEPEFEDRFMDGTMFDTFEAQHLCNALSKVCPKALRGTDLEQAFVEA